MNNMYDEQDYIEVAKEGFGFGHSGCCNYRFRVMDRQKINAVHYTNSLRDAKKCFHKCRDYWLEQDELARI